ncbi:uncharacterized protein N7498_004955 [Penicillium cinerascens]|uniref:Uncharacterized protein n=1 Tax=Penicillium cinerascens TaxID=70096 RepID=A0A9W9MMI0_9EURO|nr:uncharacterized protein N7498_004955 [Penicillium cinerascens]KAJ5204076.1 hypothetical protein N7498_004955 [Penicillium cinerascens]
MRGEWPTEVSRDNFMQGQSSAPGMEGPAGIDVPEYRTLPIQTCPHGSPAHYVSGEELEALVQSLDAGSAKHGRQTVIARRLAVIGQRLLAARRNEASTGIGPASGHDEVSTEADSGESKNKDMVTVDGDYITSLDLLADPGAKYVTEYEQFHQTGLVGQFGPTQGAVQQWLFQNSQASWQTTWHQALPDWAHGAFSLVRQWEKNREVASLGEPAPKRRNMGWKLRQAEAILGRSQATILAELYHLTCCGYVAISCPTPFSRCCDSFSGLTTSTVMTDHIRSEDHGEGWLATQLLATNYYRFVSCAVRASENDLGAIAWASSAIAESRPDIKPARCDLNALLTARQVCAGMPAMTAHVMQRAGIEGSKVRDVFARNMRCQIAVNDIYDTLTDIDALEGANSALYLYAAGTGYSVVDLALRVRGDLVVAAEHYLSEGSVSGLRAALFNVLFFEGSPRYYYREVVNTRGRLSTGDQYVKTTSTGIDGWLEPTNKSVGYLNVLNDALKALGGPLGSYENSPPSQARATTLLLSLAPVFSGTCPNPREAELSCTRYLLDYQVQAVKAGKDILAYADYVHSLLAPVAAKYDPQPAMCS